MTVITPGHTYELENFEGGLPQTLKFIHKEPSTVDPTELVTITNGTTNEELLEVLLDRLNFLQSKFPCRENALAITNIEQGLLWLNRRTQNRVKRGVEGKQLA
jgi:hypothetical protein